MYEVREGQYLVNDVAVDTFRRNVYGEASVMEVEAGTTGICGGDHEEGGRTFIHIGNKFASDFFAELCRDKDGKVVGVNIAASGDDELIGLIKCLDFASQVLKDQTMEVED